MVRFSVLMVSMVQGDVEKAEELKGWIDESRERLESQRRQRMLASTAFSSVSLFALELPLTLKPYP